ncbi:MAG: DnaJ domain-containing protein [Candidatus Adiutrix sp.]|jgi:curved DNA-binding protein|nr:DnaJ domain-containing protein [Candidatus Adiutrix sp.]
MASKNPYAVLGVGEKAGPEELRRAWLRLAVKYHPDRNPGDARAEERFKDISQAYALLSDPATRARYERLRPKPAGPKPAGPRPEPQARPAGPQAGPEPKWGAEGPRTQAGPEPKGQSEGPRPQAGPEPKGQSEGPRPQAGHEEHPDWTEILNNFFQTPKGRDTLKELEEELRRAGLQFSPGRLARWFRARRAEDPAKARLWLEGLWAWRPGGPAWARRRAARYDISYDLALSPEAAARGTTVEITYPRDGRPQGLKVNIPAGAENGLRLRLPDQGRLRPDGGRGDLVLTVLVGPRNSAAEQRQG